MEQLKAIEMQLMSAMSNQLSNLESADAKELGEVADMIKDLEEAMYYCEKIKMLKEVNEQQKSKKQGSSSGFNMSLDSDDPEGLIETMMMRSPRSKTYYPPMTDYRYMPMDEQETYMGRQQYPPMEYTYHDEGRRLPYVDQGQGTRRSINDRYMDTLKMYAMDGNGTSSSNGMSSGTSGNSSSSSGGNGQATR